MNKEKNNNNSNFRPPFGREKERWSSVIHVVLIAWLVALPSLYISLPNMEVVYTELVIELLLLFVCLFIYYHFSKFQFLIIQLGWAFFCAGIGLDVLDEVSDTSGLVHVNTEDLVIMLGISLVAFGISRASNRLLKVVARSRRQSDHYRGMAQTDSLTGLANRDKFQTRLSELIHRGRGKDNLVSVIFIDLDKFKPANDTHGHDIGDLLLQAVAARLRGVIRSADLLCRWGGDEFLILQSDFADEKVTDELASRLYEAFKNPFTVNDLKIQLGASIGYAIYPKDAGSYKELIKMADLAMYHAKKHQSKPIRFRKALLQSVVDNNTAHP